MSPSSKLVDERIAAAMVPGGRTVAADPYPWPFDGDSITLGYPGRVLTQPAAITPEARARLGFLLDRYLK